MKRIVCLFVAVLLCAVLSVRTYATGPDIDFVPSITAKPAPEMSTGATSDTTGEPVIEIYDPVNEVISACPLDHLLITPLSDIMNDEGNLSISSDAIETVKHAYELLNHPEMNILEAVPELEDELLSAGVYLDAADTVVVTAIFDVSVMCDEMKEYLSGNGNYVELTFEADIPEGYKAIVLVYKNNEWQNVRSVTQNGDGTITCTFEHFCPVIILTAPIESIDESVLADTAEVAATEAPAAEAVEAPVEAPAKSSSAWIIIAVVVVAAGAVVIGKKRKGAKENAESK